MTIDPVELAKMLVEDEIKEIKEGVFWWKIRQAILRNCPPEKNCPEGHSFEEALDWVEDSVEDERDCIDWENDSFAKHMGNCLVCAARVGELRHFGEEMGGIKSSDVFSGLELLPPELILEIIDSNFARKLIDNWNEWLRMYPGQTICLYLSKDDIQVRTWRAGRQSPVGGEIWADEQGLPPNRIFIYIP